MSSLSDWVLLKISFQSLFINFYIFFFLVKTVGGIGDQAKAPIKLPDYGKLISLFNIVHKHAAVP